MRVAISRSDSTTFDLPVQPVDDRLRRAGRHADVVDRAAVEARQRVGDRRQFGHRRLPLQGREAERAQAARLDMRQQRGGRVDRHVHIAGQQVGGRRPGAAVRHVDDVDAGHLLEQLAREMRARADARARKIELARDWPWRSRSARATFLAGSAGVHDQHVHRLRQHRDRREVLERVVGQLRHQIRIGDLRPRRGEQPRVAVGRRLGDQVGADASRRRPACSRPRSSGRGAC